MNFAEAVEAVLDITNRREKRREIELAVNAALNYFILKTKLYKDLVETSLVLDATAYNQEVDISGLTRFRSFKYVKPTGAKRYYHPAPPETIFSPAGSMQKDRYYIIGSTMTVITSALADSIQVGYYVYPPLLAGTDTHWLLDMSPYCVIDKAAARIFKSIGDDKALQIHEALALSCYKVVVQDFADSPLSMG